MFTKPYYRRNNYYYSRKGQVIRSRVQPMPRRSLTLSDMIEMAKITNQQGITIPNPNWPKPPVPPPRPEEEEEEEEAPDPPPEPQSLFPLIAMNGDQEPQGRPNGKFQIDFSPPYVHKFRTISPKS